MGDSLEDLECRAPIQATIHRWNDLDEKRHKRQIEIKARIEQMQAHLDEGGTFGDFAKTELLGYIKELREL